MNTDLIYPPVLANENKTDNEVNGSLIIPLQMEHNTMLDRHNMITTHKKDKEDRITQGERAVLRLIFSLDMSNVPLHLYDAIIGWVTNEINKPKSVNKEKGIIFLT